MAKAFELPYKFIIMGIVLIILYWVFAFFNKSSYSEGFEASNIASFLTTYPSNPVSPRIDNENSFLGMVKFCKEHAAENIANPFDTNKEGGAKFKENCGMCVTSGTIIDGTTFDTTTGEPAGVLVYKADKEQFRKEKADNQYPFTRAIPSLNSATCLGATKDNSATAALAIDSEEYAIFYSRTRCLKGTYGSGYGTGCGMCLGTKKMVWVEVSGGFKTSNMILWGFGSATVSISGVKSDSQTLSIDPSKGCDYELGRVKEGDGIEIEIIAPVGAKDIPYVYGAVYATNPDGSIYRVPIDYFIEKDLDTDAKGGYPRTGLTKTLNVKGSNTPCQELKPRPNKTSLKIRGQFPLTFVDSDQLAAVDCPSSPITLSEENTGLFTTTDPCLNPSGQGPGDYTDNCLRKTLTNNGCSTSGSWYEDPDKMRDEYPTQSVYDIKTDFTIKKAKYIGQTPQKTKEEYLKSPAAYNNYMKSCYGTDKTTPCDNFINGGVPNQACMSYLYTNKSAESPFIGAAYTGTPYMPNPTATQMAFCQAAGSLNPANPTGLAALQAIAASYNSYTGIEAVKAYLTDVFSRATGNFPQSIPDDKGGRYDSWMKCIGTPIQMATVPSAPSVSSSSGNTTITVSWSVNNGGSPITKYTINGVDVGTSTSKVFSGLTNGTSYTYTVTATNIMGTSAPGTKTASPAAPYYAPPPTYNPPPTIRTTHSEIDPRKPNCGSYHGGCLMNAYCDVPNGGSVEGNCVHPVYDQ